MRLLLDACVLFPTVMREVLLATAERGLFEPRWSARILEEWARATNKLGPGAETIARGEIATMKVRFPHAEVDIPQGLEARLWLPDPNDVHVLAAAIGAHCDTIITINASDFPKNILAEEGLSRLDPDQLLIQLHADHPSIVSDAAEAVLAEARRLSSEPWEMRSLLKKARLPRLAKALTR